MRILLMAALWAAVSFCGPALAQAGGACQPSDTLHEGLAERYGEAPAWLGVRSDGLLVELLIAPDGGTWSLVVIRPDGLACLVGEGGDWLRPGPAPAGPEA